MLSKGDTGLSVSRSAKQKQRVIQEAGYLKRAQIQRNELGKPLCRWCGSEVPRPRRTFCSDACVHEHKLRSDVDYLRATILARDHGVCCLCKTDTVALGLEVRDMASRGSDGMNQALATLMHLGYSEWRARKAIQSEMNLWDTDHIQPVVEGGGGCDLSLIRTLCVPCHTKETKQLRRRRAMGVAWNQPTIFDFLRETNDEGKQENNENSEAPG